jgi:acyl-CoA synthetase (AMP-forming)/AMP-acid ligase II
MDKPIFPPYPPTLPRALAYALEHFPDHPFLIDGERSYSYADAARISAERARALLALGIGKGTRVGLLMPNSPDWVFNWLAAGRIGAFMILISTLYQPRELGWVLGYSDVAALFTSAEFGGHDYAARLEKALPGLAEQASPELVLREHPYLRRILMWDGERASQKQRRWALPGKETLVRAARETPAVDDAFLAAAEAAVTPGDDFVAICTSGSTADPKVVVHSHGSALRIVHTYRAYRHLKSDDRDLAGMPLFWLGGLNSNLIPALFEGAALVFPPSPKMDDLLDTVVRQRVTKVGLWPVQKNALFDLARERGADFSAVREDRSEPRDAEGNVIPMNRRVGSLLGMTESFGPHGVETRYSVLPPERAGSLGHAVEGIERRIVDPDSGAVLPPGQVGELQIRGFSLMQGYYKKERGEVFTADGWFPTGDLCRLDAEGYVYFHSRKSEMIKSMGANVAPREVELQLEGLPGVREAIVFGLPDERRGEAVTALVVPLEGQSVDGEVLRTQLKDRLSAYKVPGEIIVAGHEDVPRTDSGKSRKAELIKRLPELRAAAQARSER